VGLYETYAGTTVAIVDGRGSHCCEPGHEIGRTLKPDDPSLG